MTSIRCQYYLSSFPFKEGRPSAVTTLKTQSSIVNVCWCLMTSTADQIYWYYIKIKLDIYIKFLICVLNFIGRWPNVWRVEGVVLDQILALTLFKTGCQFSHWNGKLSVRYLRNMGRGRLLTRGYSLWVVSMWWIDTFLRTPRIPSSFAL